MRLSGSHRASGCRTALGAGKRKGIEDDYEEPVAKGKGKGKGKGKTKEEEPPALRPGTTPLRATQNVLCLRRSLLARCSQDFQGQGKGGKGGQGQGQAGGGVQGKGWQSERERKEQGHPRTRAWCEMGFCKPCEKETCRATKAND